ncbi:Mss4-like protein [Geopyxis carbonaria]|nr:Mss4-like protein [Geopyxis carbonaria]
MSATRPKTLAPIPGSCLCAAIKFTIRPFTRPKQIACHCPTCRRHTGALVIYFLGVAPSEIDWAPPSTGVSTFREYQSSPGRFRGFCERCGSTLTWRSEVDGDGLVDMPIGLLDCSKAEREEFGVPTEGVGWVGCAVRGVTDDVGKGYVRWVGARGGERVVD